MVDDVCVCVVIATREMVEILQEYGGVVCCFGSSASIENTAIFLQADCRSSWFMLLSFSGVKSLTNEEFFQVWRW